MLCVRMRKFRFSADEFHRLRILYDKYIYDKLVCIIYNGDKITPRRDGVPHKKHKYLYEIIQNAEIRRERPEGCSRCAAY